MFNDLNKKVKNKFKNESNISSLNKVDYFLEWNYSYIMIKNNKFIFFNYVNKIFLFLIPLLFLIYFFYLIYNFFIKLHFIYKDNIFFNKTYEYIYYYEFNIIVWFLFLFIILFLSFNVFFQPYKILIYKNLQFLIYSLFWKDLKRNLLVFEQEYQIFYTNEFKEQDKIIWFINNYILNKITILKNKIKDFSIISFFINSLLTLLILLFVIPYYSNLYNILKSEYLVKKNNNLINLDSLLKNKIQNELLKPFLNWEDISFESLPIDLKNNLNIQNKDDLTNIFNILKEQNNLDINILLNELYKNTGKDTSFEKELKEKYWIEIDVNNILKEISKYSDVIKN